MPLVGTDVVVSGEVKPLLDIGYWRDSVYRIARSSTEGHSLSGKFDAGIAMD